MSTVIDWEREAWRLALALRDIAEASPNWMEPDAVSESERRKSEMARAALAGATWFGDV